MSSCVRFPACGIALRRASSLLAEPAVAALVCPDRRPLFIGDPPRKMSKLQGE